MNILFDIEDEDFSITLTEKGVAMWKIYFNTPKKGIVEVKNGSMQCYVTEGLIARFLFSADGCGQNFGEDDIDRIVLSDGKVLWPTV